MYKPLTEQEIEFMEHFYNPKCLMECTTPLNTLNDWENIDAPCMEVRPYQIPFIAYDVCLEDDDTKSDYDNFQLRVKAGTLVVISGRKLGKTFISLVRNILCKLVYYMGQEMTISCYDALHVRKVADEVCDYMENHLFYRQYKEKINRQPVYDIKTKNGNWLQSVNENITGKKIGQQWWSHHTHFNFQDEYQATTQEANEKKIDAKGEKGCIEILCGIPLISEGTPLANVLKDPGLKKSTIRIPQYVSPYWNEEVKKQRTLEYGGQNSAMYLINVAAEKVEGAYGAFNMQKVRSQCYTEDKVIKHFEVTDKAFHAREEALILFPMHGAEFTLVTADIGFTAATEIIIVSKQNGKYRFWGNVTAYKLSDKEVYQLISTIVHKVGGTYCAVDATVMGAPVYRQLVEEFGNERIFWTAFNENITIGFEKDNNGRVVFDKSGNPIEKKANAIVFAVQRLREMFYEGQVEIPSDCYKFDEQFSSYLQLIKGHRVSFDSSGEDHLVAAFQVFALVDWFLQMASINPLNNSNKLSMGIY